MPRASTHLVEPLPQCTNITPAGRHCRSSASDPDSLYCRSHLRSVKPALTASNPLHDLPPDLRQLSTIADVIGFLSRLLTLLSENRISPRRAAVLSYIANSMLNAMREQRLSEQAEAKAESHAEQAQTIRIDWTGVPGPNRAPQITAPEISAPAPEPLVPSTTHDSG
jgi:hypothetical protein